MKVLATGLLVVALAAIVILLPGAVLWGFLGFLDANYGTNLGLNFLDSLIAFWAVKFLLTAWGSAGDIVKVERGR